MLSHKRVNRGDSGLATEVMTESRVLLLGIQYSVKPLYPEDLNFYYPGGSLQQSPAPAGSSLLESRRTFQLPSASFRQIVR